MNRNYLIAETCGGTTSYESIGISSPILLVTLRFIRGVALGGEWAGAVLISVEHGTQEKIGRNAWFTQVGPALGTLLATGCIVLITYFSFSGRVPIVGMANPASGSVHARRAEVGPHTRNRWHVLLKTMSI
jgi:MFS family permease